MPRHADQPATHRPATPGRDGELLAVLTHHVRALSTEQIARVWWAGTAQPLANACRRVRELAAKGLVTTRELLAHPETPLRGPQAVWWPGLDPPPFPAIAHVGRNRWSGPQMLTTFVLAGEAACRAVTGRAVRELRASEATHDLHAATVFLAMRHELPTRAASWRLEEGFGDRRGAPKVPDAIVRDGLRRTAIEIVGAYEPVKLEAFHRACASRGMGYELW